MKKNYKTITILIFALTLTYSMSFAADEDYKKLESDNFIIYYHWWDAGFAKRALGWLEDIRTIAKNELGYSHDSKFKVYSPTKLKGNQPDWVSGRYYREDVAFQVLSPSSMKRAVSFDKLKELTYHEYMHSIVHLAMKEHYLPNKDREYWQWLNEGIAMYFASFKSGMKWDPGNYKEFLELIRFNKIPSLVEVGNYYMKGIEPRRSYPLSYSAAEFMVNKWGSMKVKEILESMGEGNKIQDAMNSVLGMSFEEFDKNWKEYLKEKYGR